MRFTIPAPIARGTLAADQSGVVKLPCPATLVEISACASNDSDAKLKAGTSADDDGILKPTAIGDNSAPAVWDRGDFDGALIGNDQLWHGPRGTVFTWSLDFDGASGTPAQNVDVLFTFLEG